MGDTEKVEEIKGIIEENDGISILKKRLKDISDMKEEIYSLNQEKSIRDVVNDWIRRKKAQKPNDIGKAKEDELEKMLNKSFGNSSNLVIEEPKNRMDFFVTLKDEFGDILGNVVIECKNGMDFGAKEYKETTKQICGYMSKKKSLFGILFLPNKFEGFKEINYVPFEGKKYFIFSFVDIDEFHKFLNLISCLVMSFGPKEIKIESNLKNANALLKDIGDVLHETTNNYSDFSGKFEKLNTKIKTITNAISAIIKIIDDLRKNAENNQTAITVNCQRLDFWVKEKAKEESPKLPTKELLETSNSEKD